MKHFPLHVGRPSHVSHTCSLQVSLELTSFPWPGAACSMLFARARVRRAVQPDAHVRLGNVSKP